MTDVPKDWDALAGPIIADVEEIPISFRKRRSIGDGKMRKRMEIDPRKIRRNPNV